MSSKWKNIIFQNFTNEYETKKPSKISFLDNKIYFLYNEDRGKLCLHYFDIERKELKKLITHEKLIEELKKKLNKNEISSKESLEESLLKERSRNFSSGISNYTLLKSTKEFFIPISAKELVKSKINENSEISVDFLWDDSTVKNIRMDIKISNDAKVISYIENGDIYLTLSENVNNIFQLTNCHEANKNVYAGEAKFVIQEEFDRYTGYWWSPEIIHNEKENSFIYKILYLIEDETEVEEFLIPSGDIDGKCETYKYPRVGAKNNSFKIGLDEFKIICENGNYKFEKLRNAVIDQTILGDFPWTEYIPRAEFCQDGKSFWVQLLDRRQRKLVLLQIGNEDMFNIKDNNNKLKYKIVVEENCPKYWINITNQCISLSDGNFIWSSESTGFRNLYLLKYNKENDKFQKIQITQSDEKDEFIVSGEDIQIDEINKYVYFTASLNDPTTLNLFRVSYDYDKSPEKNNFHRITPSDEYCSRFSIYPRTTEQDVVIISSLSSISKVNHSDIYIISNNYDENNNLIYKEKIENIFSQSSSLKREPVTPKIFSFISKKFGKKIYGCTYTPKTPLKENEKYPVMVYIYGGPHVQLVTNQYSLVADYENQLYCLAGYYVVVIDNVGSNNRGIEFEGEICDKMGTIEMINQVEGLIYLADQGEKIDLQRVAITGGSYGGYMSLMALCQFPQLFKIGFSRSPVTFWDAYDTGYTERYIGTPKENPLGYEISSIINNAQLLPMSESRLFIFHGLKDENVHFIHTSKLIEKLIKLGKPYNLKIFPMSRHGILQGGNFTYYFEYILQCLEKYL